MLRALHFNFLIGSTRGFAPRAALAPKPVSFMTVRSMATAYPRKNRVVSTRRPDSLNELRALLDEQMHPQRPAPATHEEKGVHKTSIEVISGIQGIPHASPQHPVIERTITETVYTEDERHKITKSYRETHEILVQGDYDREYHPVHSFDVTVFDPSIRRVLLKEGFTEPTPIQAQSWPIINDKRDVVSVAKTGSGKTIGFLAPAFQMLLEEKKNAPTPDLSPSRRTRRRSPPPKVLVLAPTRELAMQIESEAVKFANPLRLSVACLFGGVGKNPQILQLRNGVDVIVGTPGRINDLVSMGELNLNDVKYLVLDEADRMMDMGFEPQIRQIEENLAKERQTVFFTATWPKEVKLLALDFVKNPIQINIGGEEELTANTAITQNLMFVDHAKKLDELFQLIRSSMQSNPEDPRTVQKTIIFANRKMDTEDIANELTREGYFAEALHGDKSQDRRMNIMNRFRSGRLKILVATDVAARGLDVKDIDNVVNYDMPEVADHYVHRIGRTARAGKTGNSYSFISPRDTSNSKLMEDVMDVMKRSGQTVPQQLEEIVRNSKNRRGGRAAPPRSRSVSFGGPGRNDRGGSGYSRPPSPFRGQYDSDRRSSDRAASPSRRGDNSYGDSYAGDKPRSTFHRSPSRPRQDAYTDYSPDADSAPRFYKRDQPKFYRASEERGARSRSEDF